MSYKVNDRVEVDLKVGSPPKFRTEVGIVAKTYVGSVFEVRIYKEIEGIRCYDHAGNYQGYSSVMRRAEEVRPA